MREDKGKFLVNFFTMRKKGKLSKGKNPSANLYEIFFGLTYPKDK